LVFAFTGLSQAIRFMPRPVVIGFTNGIALLIASTQIKDFLGMRIPEPPSEFLGRLEVLAASVGAIDPIAVVVGAGSLVAILLTPRIAPRVPGTIVALAAGTVAAAVLDLPVETIGSRFGGIPSGLPAIAVPEFRLDLIVPLLPSAFTVAFLAAVESLLSAVVSDSMS